jgi:hypothetical protein
MKLQSVMTIFTVNLKRLLKLIDEDRGIIALRLKKTTLNSHF